MRSLGTGIMLAGLIFSSFFLSTPIVAADESSMAARDARRQAQFNLVKAVQMALTEQGYDPGPVDGLDGPATDKALRSFQSDKGLAPDGILGPRTMKALGLAD